MKTEEEIDSRLRQLVGEMVDLAPAPEVSRREGSLRTANRSPRLLLVVITLAAVATAAVLFAGRGEPDQVQTAAGGSANPAVVRDASGTVLFSLGGSEPLSLRIDPWLSETVLAELLDMPGLGPRVQERQQAIDRGGLSIRLGIEPSISAMVASVLETLPSELDAAAVTVDNASGQIVSAQSRNGQSLGAKPRAGSARLVVYAAALEGGLTLESSVDGTGPCQVTLGGTDYAVENFGGSQGSPAPLAEQVLRSSRCALARLERDLGEASVSSLFNQLTGDQLGAAAVFDAPRLTAAQHVDLVSVVANGGILRRAGLISEVRGPEGEILYQRDMSGPRVIAAETARELLAVMELNVEAGTGTNAQVTGATSAGLTGTASDFSAAWFVGTVGTYSTAIWVALPSAQPMTDIEGIAVTGGSFPAQAWAQINQLIQGGPAGDPVGADVVETIRIDAIDLSWSLGDGIDAAALRLGPSRYPATARPGEAGNVAISGHRVAWGAPFGRLDELVVGDIISLETEQRTFSYVVKAQPDGAASRVVAPSDTSVIADTGVATLTLITQEPEYSARQRLVVQAELRGEPTGPSSADPLAAEQLGELP